jgi:hypothetical protein
MEVKMEKIGKMNVAQESSGKWFAYGINYNGYPVAAIAETREEIAKWCLEQSATGIAGAIEIV